MIDLQADKIKLVGDCLIGSAFLSYCGPFNFEFRHKMIFDKWLGNVKDKELPHKEDFKLDRLLTNDVE
jgi:dynein heavy chain